MLYAIIGERKKGRDKLKELLSVLQKKQPEAELITLNDENFSEAQLDELIQSQGLFSTKYIVTLDLVGEIKQLILIPWDRSWEILNP